MELKKDERIDDLEYNICSLDETSSVRNTEINYTVHFGCMGTFFDIQRYDLF